MEMQFFMVKNDDDISSAREELNGFHASIAHTDHGSFVLICG